MTTSSQLLAAALQHHQAGRLQVAESMYREVSASDPEYADALHLIGVIAHQSGNHAAAVESIRRSLQLNANQAHVHNNLGGAYRALKQPREAVACYRRALELVPIYGDALVNLGHALADMGHFDESVASYQKAIGLNPNVASTHACLGIVFQRQGKLNEAAACYQRVLEFKPGDVEAHINLGNVLNDLGNFEQAADLYRQALILMPGLAIAHLNLGVALKGVGKIDEAIACYHRALELKPDFAEAFSNLGIALADRGDLDDSIKSYQQALLLKPDYPAAWMNLGNAFNKQGDLDEAVVCYERAVKQQPDFAKAHYNLGIVLKRQGRLNEAITAFEQALQWRPDDVETLCGMAASLKVQGKLDDAATYCRRALEVRPDCADTHNQLGNVLKDQGKLDEAVECYRRALELDASLVDAHSNLIYTLLFHPDYDQQSLFEEHQRWNQRHAAPLATFIQPHPNDRAPDRRLRIGYVSPDFRNHVVGRNLLPLFREHDHQRFEVLCYADVPFQDELTNQFRGYADIFRNVTGLNDSQLAETIRHDAIDILVDLTLHMAHNRLLVFAQKPAPIQVTFAGYPGTTGLTTIDYRLTDIHLDPPGISNDCYSELSLRLPDSFWCYDPLSSEPIRPELPAARNGHITFGCLNNFCKVNDDTLRLWASVLGEVDQSRLIVLSAEGTHRQHLLEFLVNAGVHADRVKFVANEPRQQYLKIFHDIDIGLDTIPYNGHTTSLDSLWMGVPVVTIVGRTVVGRAGLSQLMNLGLPELIARTPQEYVTAAARLARDRQSLSDLRLTLRNRMQVSPLMDAPRFARNIESAYQEIWRRWCTNT